MSIATFMKISEDSWKSIRDGVAKKNRTYETIAKYDEIKLPTRATASSAGYDFYSTEDVCVEPGTSKLINTGIRCKMDEGWVLVLCPKSGLGFRYGMHLANTVGIIDGDYFNTKNDSTTNEGHIMVKIVNPPESENDIVLAKGDKFCQGIFLPFGTASNDVDTEFSVRNGGIGSTGK